MKVSVFFAASGRARMFQDALQSLRDTTQGYEVEVVAVIDCDPESAKVAVEYEVNVLDYSPHRRGALWAWNRGLQLSSGDLLVPAGDDQIFHPDWLRYALESHQERLGANGVVGLNDLAYDGNKQVCTMWIFDRKFCKEVMGGIFAPPMYHYYCVDLEWNEKAKKHGAFFWEERSKVEHLHSAHNKRPVDATDGFKEDKWMEIDNQTFEDRKHRAFPIEWDAII